MSMRRPLLTDLDKPLRMLDILSGFYDALVQLGRTVVTSEVNQTLPATTDTKVFHGLGHAVTEWTVLNKNANADVWQSTAANTHPELYIILQASAAVTARIRFA